MHFVVRSLTYTPTLTGYLVTCYSNYPCHLFLRWTSTIPQKHVNTKMVRGAPVGTYIDQCFVVFTDQDQNEPGDTNTHTFTLEPWPYCQTRWFYFWGKVGGVLSPSASCIFRFHSEVYTFVDFYSAAGTGGDSVDGTVARIVNDQDWPSIHDGAGTSALTSGSIFYTGISGHINPDRWASIHRGILTFPTSSLPHPSIIQSATLRLYCTYVRINPGSSPSTAVFPSTPAIYNDLQPSDYNQCSAILSSNIIYYSDIIANSFVEFTLNPFGLSLINDSAPTLFSVREASYDAPNGSPPWTPFYSTGANFRAADYVTPAYRPRLRVWYSLS